MVTYNTISRPSAPTYNEVYAVANYLLINTTDYLLINSSNDRLLINSTGADAIYSTITKPSAPTYSTITKPT